MSKEKKLSKDERAQQRDIRDGAIAKLAVVGVKLLGQIAASQERTAKAMEALAAGDEVDNSEVIAVLEKLERAMMKFGGTVADLRSSVVEELDAGDDTAMPGRIMEPMLVKSPTAGDPTENRPAATSGGE